MDRSNHFNSGTHAATAAMLAERRHKNTIPSASDAPTPKYLEAGNFPIGASRARAAVNFIIALFDDEEIKAALQGKKTRGQFVLIPNDHNHSPAEAILSPARLTLEEVTADRNVPIKDVKDILYALCREATQAYRAENATPTAQAKFAELLNLATLALGNLKQF